MSKKTGQMMIEDPAINRRIDAIVAKTTMTRDDVLREALTEGKSLDWQEKFIAGVEEGLAQAERGEFASEADLDRVLNKYRPT